MSTQAIQVDLRCIELGNIKAYADVTITSGIGEVTIRGFRVVSRGGEVPWVGFPSISYQKNGSTVNKPLLDMRAGVKRQISEAVLSEFKVRTA